MTTDRAPDAPVAPIACRAAGARRRVGDPSRAAAAGVHEVGDALPRHHLARSQGAPAPAVRRPGARPGVTRGVGVVGGARRRDAPGGEAAIALTGHRAARVAGSRTRSGSTGTSWRRRSGPSSTPSPPTVRGRSCCGMAIVTPVGPVVCRRHPLWVRRTAILAQLTHRADTDVALTEVLDENLEGSTHGREFFIRKAVGGRCAVRAHRPGLGAGQGRQPRPACPASPAARPRAP